MSTPLFTFFEKFFIFFIFFNFPLFSLNAEFFFANYERTLTADFQFAKDGFGSRYACINSGAPHFN